MNNNIQIEYLISTLGNQGAFFMPIISALP
nr:MAG TPA: hypothetical protein [Caudoviricetes sp.]